MKKTAVWLKWMLFLLLLSISVGLLIIYPRAPGVVITGLFSLLTVLLTHLLSQHPDQSPRSQPSKKTKFRGH